MNSTILKNALSDPKLNLEKVAARAEMPLARLLEIGNGADCSVRELRQIATGLGVSMSDLVPSTGPTKSENILFRAVSAKGIKPDPTLVSNISKRMDWSLSLMGEARGKTRWHELFGRSNDYADAESNAAQFRSLYFRDDHASPITQLPRLLSEGLGMLLFVVNIASIDGASAFIGGKSFIFVSKRFEGRMLFTLAHELAHILSHHSQNEDFAFIDEYDEYGPSRSSKKRKEEQYAHAFASCLLMPPTGVGVALKKIREKSGAAGALGDIEILLLSRIFGVSFWAAAKRCEDLRLLPRGGAQSLNDKLKKEYGSPEKRAEAIGLPPRVSVEFPNVPRPLLDSAVQRIKEGTVSIGRAAAMLGLSIEDLIAANKPVVQ